MGVVTALWLLLPMAFYGLLALSLPPPGPPLAWRMRVHERWSATRERWRERQARRHPPPPPDPFAALHLQLRLAALAAQVRAIETDRRMWARARRLEAVQAAYDALLLDACRLAGLPVPETTGWGRLTEVERLDDELALVQAGWSW